LSCTINSFVIAITAVAAVWIRILVIRTTISTFVNRRALVQTVTHLLRDVCWLIKLLQKSFDFPKIVRFFDLLTLGGFWDFLRFLLRPYAFLFIATFSAWFSIISVHFWLFVISVCVLIAVNNFHESIQVSNVLVLLPLFVANDLQRLD